MKNFKLENMTVAKHEGTFTLTFDANQIAVSARANLRQLRLAKSALELVLASCEPEECAPNHSDHDQDDKTGPILTGWQRAKI
ncbi:hypothetical protein [Microvirga pudoricolor]|uniref:hypothetical protein n=1 Tax=Microvirga pudoricolor TaxID=2778729 RepID=UPI001951BB76|nr:hypothetical protein [Microvirga pudoricolor]MBM6595249.1 hypothetical protein [Microvirga pudoricolor]